MADEPEEIEIVIEGEEQDQQIEPEIEVAKTDEAPKPAEPAPKAEDDVDKTLEALRKQLDDEKQARIAAEKDAHEARSTVVRAQGDIQDSQLGQITSAIETVRQHIEIQKSNYRTARESGDIDAEWAANEALAESKAILIQLNQGKEALENAPKPESPAPYRPSDPVEALASQLSPRSASWVRSHPEYAQDNRLYSKMLAAHNLAVADGIPADTDDYFSAIETTLGLRQQALEDDAMSDAAKPAQRRSAPAAAPVSRGGNGNGSGGQRVTLTRDQIEIAEMMGQTPQEYAKHLMALKAEGKLN